MYVLANAAVSVDGKLATRERRQVALSGAADFERVDRLRASMDAVMVGVGTVLADDPSLTTGAVDDGAEQPTRVVADTDGRTPVESRVLDASAPTVLLVGADVDAPRRRELEAAGATVLPVAGADRPDLAHAIDQLGDRGIDRLLVEGGGELLFSMFADGLVDELTLFTSPTLIGGRDAPTLLDGDGFTERFPRLELLAADRLDDGLLCRYRVAGWEPTPSADQSVA